MYDILQKGILLLVVILGPYSILKVHCILFKMLVQENKPCAQFVYVARRIFQTPQRLTVKFTVAYLKHSY